MKFLKKAEINKNHYVGDVASKYDSVRDKEFKWISEQNIVRSYLSRVPKESTILDIPVGTGRFLEFYREFGLIPTGMDTSEDMLRQSRNKSAQIKVMTNLLYSDIRNIEANNDSFEHTVCIRLLNHLGSDNIESAISELSRVTSKSIICGVRTLAPFRELVRDRQLRQWPAQQLLRAFPLVRRSALSIYNPRKIERIIEKNRMRIIDKTRVIQRKHGIDYFIYSILKY